MARGTMVGRNLLLLVGAWASIAAAPLEKPFGADGCTGCHRKGGAAGLLIGSPAPDTQRQLDQLRDGRRPSTIMRRILTGYTTDELVAIATWFATQ